MQISAWHSFVTRFLSAQAPCTLRAGIVPMNHPVAPISKYLTTQRTNALPPIRLQVCLLLIVVRNTQHITTKTSVPAHNRARPSFKRDAVLGFETRPAAQYRVWPKELPRVILT